MNDNQYRLVVNSWGTYQVEELTPYSQNWSSVFTSTELAPCLSEVAHRGGGSVAIPLMHVER